jgi:hypothetical protein
MSAKINIDSPSQSPGTLLRGHVTWQLDDAPSTAELRLRWTLRHDRDEVPDQSETVAVIDVASVPADSGQGDPYRGLSSAAASADLRARDRRRFELALPQSPYSFTGDLAKLSWELELELTPGPPPVTIPLTLSPTGEVVDIASPEGKDEASRKAELPS